MSDKLQWALFAIGVVGFFVVLFKLLRYFQRQDDRKRREYFEGLAEHFGGQYFHADIFAFVLAEFAGRIFTIGLSPMHTVRGRNDIVFEISIAVYGDVPPDLRAFQKARGKFDFSPWVEVDHGNQALRGLAHVLAKEEPRAKSYLTTERLMALHQALSQYEAHLTGNALIHSRLHHVSIKRKPKWIEERLQELIPLAKLLDTQDHPANLEEFKEQFSQRQWLKPRE